MPKVRPIASLAWSNYLYDRPGDLLDYNAALNESKLALSDGRASNIEWDRVLRVIGEEIRRIPNADDSVQISSELIDAAIASEKAAARVSDLYTRFSRIVYCGIRNADHCFVNDRQCTAAKMAWNLMEQKMGTLTIRVYQQLD